MNERDSACLIQYDLQLNTVKKVRAGLLCDTSEGIFLLKEAGISESRAVFEQSIFNQLDLPKGLFSDSYIANKEGNLITKMPDGSCYLLRKWHAGKECDARNNAEVKESFRALANLHNALRNQPRDDTWVMQKNLTELWQKHSRELRRARAYIRKKKIRSEYERFILNSIDVYIAQADLALNQLNEMEEAWLSVALYHGDYNYHHVIFGKQEIWLTQFHQMKLGYQVTDVYHFLRKILEKNSWKLQLGQQCLSAYEEILPLSEAERSLLYLMFLYPDKYWKQVHQYLTKSKTWIPEKNFNKLQNIEMQEADRQNFIRYLEKCKALSQSQ